MTLLFPRPCLTCGKLTRYGPRCEADARAHRAKYTGDWPRLSRAWINAHPVCVRCGETRRSLLTADHVEAGSLRLGLQTLCRPCNGRKSDRAQ